MFRLLKNLGTSFKRKSFEEESKPHASYEGVQAVGLGQVVTLGLDNNRRPRPGPLPPSGSLGGGPNAKTSRGADGDERDVSDFGDSDSEGENEQQQQQQQPVWQGHGAGVDPRLGLGLLRSGGSITINAGAVVSRSRGSVTTPKQGSATEQAPPTGASGDVAGLGLGPRFHSLLDPEADLPTSQYYVPRTQPRWEVNTATIGGLVHEGNKLNFELVNAEIAAKQVAFSGGSGTRNSALTASFTGASRPGAGPAPATGRSGVYAGGSFSVPRRGDNSMTTGGLRPTPLSLGGSPQLSGQNSPVASRVRPTPGLLSSCPSAAATIGAQLTWEPPPAAQLLQAGVQAAPAPPAVANIGQGAGLGAKAAPPLPLLRSRASASYAPPEPVTPQGTLSSPQVSVPAPGGLNPRASVPLTPTSPGAAGGAGGTLSSPFGARSPGNSNPGVAELAGGSTGSNSAGQVQPRGSQTDNGLLASASLRRGGGGGGDDGPPVAGVERSRGSMMSLLGAQQPGLGAVTAGMRRGARTGTLLDTSRVGSVSAAVSPLAAQQQQQLLAPQPPGPPIAGRRKQEPQQHPLAGYLSSILSPEELQQLAQEEAPPAADESAPAAGEEAGSPTSPLEPAPPAGPADGGPTTPTGATPRKEKPRPPAVKTGRFIVGKVSTGPASGIDHNFLDRNPKYRT